MTQLCPRGRGTRHHARHAIAEVSGPSALLFQRLGDMLGVLLMTLEYLETGGQKVLQLAIAGVGDQDGFERRVSVCGSDLVVGISLVEGCAAELFNSASGTRLFGCALLVSLSCGVTLSFPSTRAWSFTAL